MANENNGEIAVQGGRLVQVLAPDQYRVDYSEPFSKHYSNVARIAKGEYDICIDFAQLASPQDVTETPGAPLVLRVVSQVIMPQGLMPKIVALLYKHLSDDEKSEVLSEITLEDSSNEESDIDAPTAA